MPTVSPLLTWLVILGEFLFVLGGLRPTDAQRDLALALGAVVIVALQVPLVLRWRRLAREEGAPPVPRRELLWTLIRLGFVAYFLWFLHGVSYGA